MSYDSCNSKVWQASLRDVESKSLRDVERNYMESSKFSSAPILLRHFCVLFKRKENNSLNFLENGKVFSFQ